MKQAILIFVKNAVKGKVKTRLAATLGDDVAFDIYQQLLKHTENCTDSLVTDKIVFYSDYLEAVDIWNNGTYHKQTQVGSDLGERMHNAFEYAFANGYKQVAIIGSDCFEINAAIIEKAFVQLGHSDVVLGPALDGGYYLLGLKSPCHEIFQDIQWSTDQVLIQTMQVCHKLGLKTTQLQELSDIDNEADLKKWITNN
ncbi:rSAM/selenodomain-associated transferase 1 [Pedobacter sp. CG_S7]|uniref:TIGR04282 family arsenosugar biosynthesis glycosyltransferase n=1 Tax=Pedobacter sp. CG_S7 TaxID=3143930 RepID=UPI00339430E7